MVHVIPVIWPHQDNGLQDDLTWKPKRGKVKGQGRKSDVAAWYTGNRWVFFKKQKRIEYTSWGRGVEHFSWFLLNIFHSSIFYFFFQGGFFLFLLKADLDEVVLGNSFSTAREMHPNTEKETENVERKWNHCGKKKGIVRKGLLPNSSIDKI